MLKKSKEKDYKEKDIASPVQAAIWITCITIAITILLFAYLAFIKEPIVSALDDSIHYDREIVNNMEDLDFKSLDKDSEIKVIGLYSTLYDYLILETPSGDIVKFRCTDEQMDRVNLGEVLSKSDLNLLLVEQDSSNDNSSYLFLFLPLIFIIFSLNSSRKNY